MIQMLNNIEFGEYNKKPHPQPLSLLRKEVRRELQVIMRT
jgi:hypothetical protein